MKDFILQGHDDLEASGIALASAASEQLPVDAPGIVALGGEHVESAHFGHARSKPDVRPRPAMLVATVMRPRSPALAITSASSWSWRAFNTWCVSPPAERSSLKCSEADTERVPTSTARPSFCKWRSVSTMATHFSSAVT